MRSREEAAAMNLVAEIVQDEEDEDMLARGDSQDSPVRKPF